MSFQALSKFSELIARFKHPYSLPTDIGKDLGLFSLNNYMSFCQLTSFLDSPDCHPTKLCKGMSKKAVINSFKNAYRQEDFSNKSLFCYYFKQGWIQFEVTFDELGGLKSLRFHCNNCHVRGGVEIPLTSF